MTTLNRSKPFAEIYGESAPYRYEQDGKGFDQEGKEVVSTSNTTAPAGSDSGNAELDAMDLAALKAKATEMGLSFHPLTGEVKMRALVLAAMQPASTTAPAGSDSQVDAQLAAG